VRRPILDHFFAAGLIRHCEWKLEKYHTDPGFAFVVSLQPPVRPFKKKLENKELS
jgi:hypothetical protein